MMKKTIYIFIAALLWAGSSASGQLYRTSYFMEGAPQRGAFNPAFRPYRGYIQIPGIGNLNLDYASNALAVDNLIYPLDGKNVLIFNEAVKWNDIEGFLKPSNDIDIEVSMPIISFGFFSGRGFWTFDTKIRTDAGFSLPKDLFHFMKGVESGPQHYSMSNMAVGADAYLTVSLGYSYRIFENLTVGGRVNFLGGLAHAKVQYDRLDVNLTKEAWEINAAGNFTVAGPGITVAEKYDKDVQRDIIDFGNIGFDINKVKGLAGYGMTFDIGAEYELLDRIKFSFSVLDIGFMRWNKKDVTYATSEANYIWAGTGEDGTSGNFDDFTRFYKLDQAPDIKSKIYATFVAGAELDVFDNDILGIGLMYMNKKNEFVRRSEISVALTLRPVGWFSASVNYAIRDYKDIGDSQLNTLGLALDFHAGWINLFAGTDYIISKINPQYIPVSQKAMNFYMGISIPLARERKNMKFSKL